MHYGSKLVDNGMYLGQNNESANKQVAFRVFIISPTLQLKYVSSNKPLN